MRHRLHARAGRLQHLLDGFGEQFAIRSVVDETAAAQKQIVVIAGKAFEKPEQVGVVFLAVVIARKLRGPQALDVPGMEILVADQAQERGVALARLGLAYSGQVAPGGDQRGAVAMLQAAIAFGHGVQHKNIVRKRHLARQCFGRLALLAMPKADLGFANSACVGQQAFAVKRRQSACNYQAVRNAAGDKLATPKRAQLKWAIGQFVVIHSLVSAKSTCVGAYRRQAGSHLPAAHGRAGEHLDALRPIGLPRYAQAQAGRIEKAAHIIQPSRAHGVVKGVDLVLHLQRLRAVAAHLPSGLASLCQRHTAPALGGTHCLHMLRELAHQIAARNPHRQSQVLHGGRLGNG